MDDDSNDVECIDSSHDESDPDSGEKRPLMLLLRCLIRNKQNTVMTNAQIVNILRSEFNISVNTSHELAVDIYIKIIKKYLKDWPQWEELERISSKLTRANDLDAVTNVLNHKYKNLKEYLGVMLEAAKPLAEDAVRHVEAGPSRIDDAEDRGDVVMEIQCTREQLNHLFFRQPCLEMNNTVFNIARIEPSRITFKPLSYVDILNVWWLKININLPYFIYAREIVYRLNHTLVNRIRKENIPPEVLDTDLFLKPVKKSKEYDKMEIFNKLNSILKGALENDYTMGSVLTPMFEVFRTDLLETFTHKLKVPSTYRRCASKHRYVRYLYADNVATVASNNSKYDLQLEETVAPTYQFYIGKMGVYETPPKEIGEWLKIECMFCKIKFTVDVNLREALQSHYLELHQDEPEWNCMNCQQTFTMETLAKNRWKHTCISR